MSYMINSCSMPSKSVGSRPIALPDDSDIVSESLTFEQDNDNYRYYDVKAAISCVTLALS